MKWWIVLALAVVGCGGAQQTDWSWKFQKENQITALWTQIRDWRREAHMDLDPVRNDVFQVRGRPIGEVRRVCVADHEVPPKCNDICDLSVAICDNAEAICGIADELGKNDHDAQDKCTSAKASCREAKQRCCNCSGDAP